MPVKRWKNPGASRDSFQMSSHSMASRSVAPSRPMTAGRVSGRPNLPVPRRWVVHRVLNKRRQPPSSTRTRSSTSDRPPSITATRPPRPGPADVAARDDAANGGFRARRSVSGKHTPRLHLSRCCPLLIGVQPRTRLSSLSGSTSCSWEISRGRARANRCRGRFELPRHGWRRRAWPPRQTSGCAPFQRTGRHAVQSLRQACQTPRA